MTETPVIGRVRQLVEPIASDLELDLYDLEQRGGTLRVTLDTPPGSDGGVDLDKLALATRLISREMDHQDPIPGRYTLEVTSPGLERTLRTPEHFQREIGKQVTIRLSNVENDRRRVDGVLVAADGSTATVRTGDESAEEPNDVVVDLGTIDRARTVFEWGPKPKPGGKGSAKGNKSKKNKKSKQVGQANAPANEQQTATHAAKETS